MWTHNEYEDWSEAIDQINGTDWRTTHLSKFHDYNIYSYTGSNRSILFGVIDGHPCEPITPRVSYCVHDRFGVIVFMLRYWLMTRTRDEIMPLSQYDTVVVTRPNNMYLCQHKFTDLNLQNYTIWVSTGEKCGVSAGCQLACIFFNILKLNCILSGLL